MASRWHRMNAEQKARKVARDRKWQRERGRKLREARRSREAANPDLVVRRKRTERDSFYRARYGITEAEYEALFVSQNGVCAVCRQSCASGKRLSVDHHHETGIVRGLLCLRCNVGIGHLQDDPMRLRAAADYLEKAR